MSLSLSHAFGKSYEMPVTGEGPVCNGGTYAEGFCKILSKDCINLKPLIPDDDGPMSRLPVLSRDASAVPSEEEGPELVEDEGAA